MPKANSAHITFVLDRSGSMQTKKEPTIAGFNSFIEKQKAVPGECTATLLQFDNPRQHEYVYKNLPLANVPLLTKATFVPRGSTALVDAIGQAIDDTGAALAAKPEAERPSRVYIVILTDGEENASAEYQMTPEAPKPAWWNAIQTGSYVSTFHEPPKKIVAEMIQHQKDKYNWEFVFLGADQDAIQVAQQLHIPAANTISYRGGKKGTESAMASLTQNMMYAREQNVQLDSVGFNNLQREAALEKDDENVQ